jgi:hypothetical protein
MDENTRYAASRRYSDFAVVLRSVKTPLGFFTLIALLLDGIILAAAITTERVPLYWPLLVLGVVVVGMFALVWWRPHALYDPTELQTITVNLIFPDSEIPRDFDLDNCHFVVRGIDARKKYEGNPNLVPGPGGWSFTLSVPALSTDSVRIVLTDSLGRRWQTQNFRPYQTMTNVVRESEPPTL